MMKRIAIGFIAVLACGIAFYIGGCLGFSKGLSSAYFMGSADAMETTMALAALDVGDTDRAVELLDAELDRALFDNQEFRQAYGSVFDLTRIAFDPIESTKNIDASASWGALYRLEKPSTSMVTGPLQDVVSDSANRLARTSTYSDWRLLHAIGCASASEE